MNFFNLQDGEEIIWEAKPLPGLKWLMIFGTLVVWGVLGLFLIFPLLGVFLLSAFMGGILGFIGAIIGFVILLAIIIGLSYIPANMRYKKEYYWITNNRIIHKRGFLGYTVNSIPLERVSDVIISRSFLESIFKISSVNVQSLAGQVSHQGGRFGAEGQLRAVEDPEGLQKLIFELVKKNREEKHLGI